MNDIWEEVKQSIDPETDRVFLLVLGGLFSTCFFVGLTFNVAALCFFSKRSTKLKFKVMFRAAACVDISICFLSMFIAREIDITVDPRRYIFCWGHLTLH